MASLQCGAHVVSTPRCGRMRVQWQRQRKSFRSAADRAVACASGEAGATTVADSEVPEATSSPKDQISLVCPICYREISNKADSRSSSTALATLECRSCSREFSPVQGQYLDLTLSGSKSPRAPSFTSRYADNRPASTQIFRSSSVSFAYERGWRQSFAWAGFPGVDTEFGYAMDYVQSCNDKGEENVLVDLSCGSGLFTRKFIKSKKFSRVVAVDFSESMLSQAYEFLKGDSIEKEATLIRADVARLPFATGSIDFIHAGAALHCWPEPTLAIAEISRVLRPGGAFIGSTFLDPTAILGQIVGNDDIFAPLADISRNSGQTRAYRWWTEPEIRDLLDLAGLESFSRKRERQFILWMARKPTQES